MASDPMAAARACLDRGEYGQVRRLLEPLLESIPATSAEGAELRLLLATALMGQGSTAEAADRCRELRRCADPTLRAQARDLLTVLEAPALQRPAAWSLTLPDLSGTPAIEGKPVSLRRRRTQGPPPPPPPPVGPTQAPQGFAALIVALLVVLLLASLLGGCLQVRTDLRFEGPGRLQVAHELRSDSGQASPWQRRFAASLEAGQPAFRAVDGSAAAGTTATGALRLSTPVLPASEALEALARSVSEAGRLASLELAAPQLAIRETNWILGVRQRLSLEFDLEPLAGWSGLDLALRLEPLRSAAVARAEPEPVVALPGEGRRLLWRLQPGALNRLELRCWRWSPLGLGAAAIALGLGLVLLLQRIRLRLGFGLPELPA